MGFARQEYWSGVPLPSPEISTENLEKLWHVPGNVECYVHVQGYAHAQERPKKDQADPEALHKQEVKAKTELESACLNVKGVSQRLAEFLSKDCEAYQSQGFTQVSGASLEARGTESTFQCGRHGFDSWPEKIPHAAEKLSPYATTELMQESLGATTTQANAAAAEALTPWSLCSTREGSTLRSLRTAAGAAPLTTAGEKQHSNEDPARPETNVK